MEVRILVGSCGGLTGSYLVRQFHQIPGCYVIGADAETGNSTRYFTDEFSCLPHVSSPDFVPQLICLLREKKVDCYFPTHSREILEISRLETQLRSVWNGGFLVSPYETFEALNNKRTANETLRKAGIPVPELLENYCGTIQYPVFMKPDEGSGSRKAMAIETPLLHRAYRDLDPSCSFYQLIEGQEYTVDCIFDTQGHLLAYNQRLRCKRMGGAVIMTQNNYDFDISPWLKKLEKAFIFKGCVNFQYILSEGVPYFIDVNLRYASGGLPLTVASGIKVPQILLDLLLHRPLGEIPSCPADRKIMYRYFNEIYEDEKI